MRLIDADRALEIVRDQAIAHPNAYYLTTYATLTLREAPTIDAVPVVRCRECVWSHMRTDPQTLHSAMVCGYKGYNQVQSSQVTDNDFCSHGEPKEGAG